MKRALTAGLLALSPLAAHAAGGGGLTIDGVYQPRYGEGAHDAPGLYSCIGGVGYGVFGKGFRLGGDGSYCRGSDGDVQSTFGGVQLGHWRSHGMFFWSAYASVGGGVFLDGTTPGQSAYKTAFGYVKPTLSSGIALGPTAIELGAYAMVPINFIQDVGNGSPRGVVTPSFGVQVSFLFGWFRDNKKRREVVEVPPPAPYQADPCAAPPYGPDCEQERFDDPCAGPPYGPDCGVEEDAPLAIPWGAVAPGDGPRGVEVTASPSNDFTVSPTNEAEAATGPVELATGDVSAQSGPVGPVTATTGAISVGNIEVAPAVCPACPSCPASPDVQVFNVCGSSNSLNLGGDTSSQQRAAAPPPPAEAKADAADEAPLALPAQ